MNSRSTLGSCQASALALALGLTLCLAPRVARAERAKEYAPCTRQPTETDIAGAKGAFQAGQVSFDEADYRRAIDYWEDAYRRDCTAHALLLNLARAYELNGAKDHAVTALTTYLDRVPATPDQDKIQRRIDVLRRQLESERTVAATPAAPPTAPSSPPAAAVQPETGEVSADAGSTVARERRPLLPLIVAGAGGAITIVGVIFYIPAYSDLKDVEEQCPDHSNCAQGTSQSVLDRGNDARTRMKVAGAITIGGLAVLGGGLAWYFLSPRSPGTRPPDARWSPVLARGYAGVSYAGSF